MEVAQEKGLENAAAGSEQSFSQMLFFFLLLYLANASPAMRTGLAFSYDLLSLWQRLPLVIFGAGEGSTGEKLEPVGTGLVFALLLFILARHFTALAGPISAASSVLPFPVADRPAFLGLK